jgi:hypothetical protein
MSEQERIAGHHCIEGTDLEVVFNLRGKDLVVRVNKGSVQVFRALLADAAKDMRYDALFDFNAVSPDVAFTIGDFAEGRERMVASYAGLARQELKR